MRVHLDTENNVLVLTRLWGCKNNDIHPLYKVLVQDIWRGDLKAFNSHARLSIDIRQ
jgi:hypothetical protein